MSSGPDALLSDMARLLRGGGQPLTDDGAPTFAASARIAPAMTPAAVTALVLAGGDRDPADVTASAKAFDARLTLFTTVLPTPATGARGAAVAVKDLFDIEGVVTRAGSTLRAAHPPASADATTVARLREAGAHLVGATNMDEFAYGFTTENSHFGTTRNPHDPDRIAGGSSGGSAAAVAAGVVRIALGTDTNGSIRVPAAFCGIFGLRPTYGLVPRTGAVAFVPGLDAVGPLARTPDDIALAMDVIAGPDGVDPTCSEQPAGAPSYRDALDRGIDGLRVVSGAGELWNGAHPDVEAAARLVCDALGARAALELPDVGRARGAAIVITAAEGAAQHRDALLATPDAFDVRTRGRFLAGLGVPAIDYIDAQRFRRWWQQRVLAVLAEIDILVVPTVACLPPLLDAPTVEIAGRQLPTGAVLGRFTQPLSLIGLPALSVPVLTVDGLPAGVQLVGRPGSDATLIAAAAHLHRTGIATIGHPAVSVATLEEVV